METVDNLEEVSPAEDKGIDQESFNILWQSFYNQNLKTLEDVFKQVGQSLKIEMESQIENFDIEGEHKEMFTEAVRKGMPDSAEPYIMGIINGGLVVLLEVARRLDLDATAVQEMLNDLNPNAHKTKEEALNESKSVQQPI